jgi:hypothetical protein
VSSFLYVDDIPSLVIDGHLATLRAVLLVTFAGTAKRMAVERAVVVRALQVFVGAPFSGLCFSHALTVAPVDSRVKYVQAAARRASVNFALAVRAGRARGGRARRCGRLRHLSTKFEPVESGC